MPRFQFSLAAVFYAFTACAVVCFIGRWDLSYTKWALLTGAFLLAAGYAAKRRSEPELAWGLLAIAWYIALIGSVNGLVGSFSNPPKLIEFQRCFAMAYVCSLAMPLLLSWPVVYLAARNSRGSRSSARKWIIAGPIVGLIDVTLVIVWLLAFIGHVIEVWYIR